MVITISGTEAEILAWARRLVDGNRPMAMGTQAPPVEPNERRYLDTVCDQGVLAAVKMHRADTGMALKESKDYIESLVQKALNAGLLRQADSGYTFEWVNP